MSDETPDPRIALIAERFIKATKNQDATAATEAKAALTLLKTSETALKTARSTWPSAGTTAIKTVAVNTSFPLILDALVAILTALHALIRATVRDN